MPKFNFAVPHDKTLDEVKTALKAYMEKSREFYAKQLNDMTEDWSAWDTANRYGFGFNTFGFNIKGAMTVDDKQVRVDGDLPFAAMMFKGKVEESFRKMVDRALANA
jgi:hypothetical protein